MSLPPGSPRHRIESALSKVAHLVAHDLATYAPIFERLDAELHVIDVSSPEDRARSLIRRSKVLACS